MLNLSPVFSNFQYIYTHTVQFFTDEQGKSTGGYKYRSATKQRQQANEDTGILT